MRLTPFPFSIAYADTDAGGIVYHGRYLEIAERARMSWLRGVTRAGDDIGFVIRELNIKYIRPLCLGDEFTVDGAIIKIGPVSMDMEQKFVKDGVVYAILTLTAVYIDKNMRPKRIPDQILNIINK